MTGEGVQDRLLSEKTCTTRVCLAPSHLCKTVKENSPRICGPRESLEAQTPSSYLRMGWVCFLPFFVSLRLSVLCKILLFTIE